MQRSWALKTPGHSLNSPATIRIDQKAPALALIPANSGNANPADKAAKTKAAQQDVFLREVDDALRQDQMEGFFKRYGLPVLGVIVVALLGFAGFLYWQHHSQARTETGSEQLTQALDSLDASNLPQANEKFAALAKESGNTAVLARLGMAGVALKQGKADDAAKIYGEVAADAKAPQQLRDLATVREVAATYDKLKPQQVIDRLKPLAVPGNPWFGVAGEMVGMAYLAQGKKDLAGPLFVQIAKDDSVPASLQSRTQQLAGQLGFDALPDVVDENGEAIKSDVKLVAKPATPAGQ